MLYTSHGMISEGSEDTPFSTSGSIDN